MTSYRPSKTGTDLCLHVVYSFMLLLTAVLGTIAIAAPYWLITPQNLAGNRVAIGIVSSCSDHNDADSCERYGNDPEDIPVDYWRGTAGTFVFAMMVVWLCFIFSLFTCCCCQALTRPQIGLLFLSAILIIVALFLFGAGLGSDFVETGGGIVPNGCGDDADQFNRGNCDLGYAGGLAVATFVFVVISATISIFVKPAEDQIA